MLRKSRRQESIDNYGGYMVIDPYRNIPYAGFRFDLDLDGVERFLNEYEKG